MNHDLVGLDNRLNRFLVELHKAVSANQGDETYPFDVARMLSYLDAAQVYHNWMVAQPQLDLPETAPRMYKLMERPELPQVENESVNDMIRMFIIMRDEICCSQSARRPCGMNQFDSARFTSILLKMRNFITDFVQVATPLDMPESSPMMPSSGAGRGGIEPS